MGSDTTWLIRLTMDVYIDSLFDFDDMTTPICNYSAIPLCESTPYILQSMETLRLVESED